MEKSTAQLFFKYGAANSGRTIKILKAAHSYGEQNEPVALMTGGIDTRDGLGVVSSRIGLKRGVMPIPEETDVFSVIQSMESKPCCTPVSEAQFLKRKRAIAFTRIVNELDIPVMALDLKDDSRNELSGGSGYLLPYTDKIEEMRTIYRFYHREIIMNLHCINGKPVYESSQMQIGRNEAYHPVCRKYCFHPSMITGGE